MEKLFSVLGRSDLSEMLLASELRRVTDELQPVLAEGGFVSAFAASRQHPGTQFTEALLADLRRFLKQ
jgi:hypothetical protein